MDIKYTSMIFGKILAPSNSIVISYMYTTSIKEKKMENVIAGRHDTAETVLMLSLSFTSLD